jgi:N-acetylglucosaminyldiphosphoundecaprenol N-acetyl-beta-D-mannosaminyltransferase
VEILGIGVDPIPAEALLDRVAHLVAGEKATVAYANVHVLNTAVADGELRTFLQGVDLCYCDGNGVKLGARILGADIPARMTGADWIWDLAARAVAEDWRIHWIGGAPGVTAAAARALCEVHPELQITTDHGFHAREGDADIACVARINEAEPHIVLVGMGTPTQEAWVAQRRARIAAPVVWCLGATADFISGAVPRVGPAWLVQRHEWLSRLMADPLRLWKRYLLGNTAFLWRIAMQKFRG